MDFNYVHKQFTIYNDFITKNTVFFYLSPYKSKSEIEFWRNEVHANTTVEKGLQEAPELTFFTSLERVADILSKWSTHNTLKSTPKAYLYMLRPNTDAVLKTNHFECGEKISSVRVLDAPRLLKFLFKESPYIALNASMFLPVPGSLVIESLFTPSSSSRSIQNDRVKAQVKFLHQKSANSDACTAMLLGFIDNVNPSYHSMMNSDPKKDLGVVFSHEFGALTVFYLGNDNTMEFCDELSKLGPFISEGKIPLIMVHSASFSKFCNLFKFQKLSNLTSEFKQDGGKYWEMEPKEDGFWMRLTIIDTLGTASLTGKPILHLSDLMASSGVTKLHNATVSKPLRHHKNYQPHNHSGLILDLELYEPDSSGQTSLLIIPDEIEHHHHGAQRPILRIPDLLH